MPLDVVLDKLRLSHVRRTSKYPQTAYSQYADRAGQKLTTKFNNNTNRKAKNIIFLILEICTLLLRAISEASEGVSETSASQFLAKIDFSMMHSQKECYLLY